MTLSRVGYQPKIGEEKQSDFTVLDAYPPGQQRFFMKKAQ
jgi:uncharacterized protein YjlB